MTKLVLIETLSQFRHRYVVELHDTADIHWAIEDVLMSDDVEEMSQLHLGEICVSNRVIDSQEYIRIFDQDNDYLQPWTDEQKLNRIYKFKQGNE